MVPDTFDQSFGPRVLISTRLLALAAILLLPLSAAFAAEGEQGVRVGIVAYEDFDGEFAHWEKIFASVAAQNGQTRLKFRLAVGT